eukprot:498063-Karenia_brevis.AAC.1
MEGVPDPPQSPLVSEQGEVNLETSFDSIYESNMVAEPMTGAAVASSTGVVETTTGTPVVVAVTPEVQTVD